MLLRRAQCQLRATRKASAVIGGETAARPTVASRRADDPPSCRVGRDRRSAVGTPPGMDREHHGPRESKLTAISTPPAVSGHGPAWCAATGSGIPQTPAHGRMPHHGPGDSDLMAFLGHAPTPPPRRAAYNPVNRPVLKNRATIASGHSWGRAPPPLGGRPGCGASVHRRDAAQRRSDGCCF